MPVAPARERSPKNSRTRGARYALWRISEDLSRKAGREAVRQRLDEPASIAIGLLDLALPRPARATHLLRGSMTMHGYATRSPEMGTSSMH
jgi:hypothetical protein